MLWRLVPLFLGLLGAWLIRGGAIHEALRQRRTFRAFLIWFRACLVTVPGAFILAFMVLIVTDLLR